MDFLTNTISRATSVVDAVTNIISNVLLPDGVVLDLSQWIHEFEEWSLPMPSANSVMWSAIIGIPVALAVHDSSHLWLDPKDQKSFSGKLPVVSWFQRRWRKSEKTKARDLHLARDAVIFFYIAATLYEGQSRSVPMDYLADRLVNSTTRAILTREMQSKRSSVYAAAQGVLASGSAGDPEKVMQMKETAMRRRLVQENLQN